MAVERGRAEEVLSAVLQAAVFLLNYTPALRFEGVGAIRHESLLRAVARRCGGLLRDGCGTLWPVSPSPSQDTRAAVLTPSGVHPAVLLSSVVAPIVGFWTTSAADRHLQPWWWALQRGQAPQSPVGEGRHRSVDFRERGNADLYSDFASVPPTPHPKPDDAPRLCPSTSSAETVFSQLLKMAHAAASEGESTAHRNAKLQRKLDIVSSLAESQRHELASSVARAAELEEQLRQARATWADERERLTEEIRRQAESLRRAEDTNRRLESGLKKLMGT